MVNDSSRLGNGDACESVVSLCSLLVASVLQAVVQTILAVYRFAAVFAMSILAFIGLGMSMLARGSEGVRSQNMWIVHACMTVFRVAVFRHWKQFERRIRIARGK